MVAGCAELKSTVVKSPEIVAPSTAPIRVEHCELSTPAFLTVIEASVLAVVVSVLKCANVPASLRYTYL
jgi:hypothetical protein